MYRQLSCQKGGDEAQGSRHDIMVRQGGNENGCMHTSHFLAKAVRCQADPPRRVYKMNIGTRETSQTSQTSQTGRISPVITIALPIFLFLHS